MSIQSATEYWSTVETSGLFDAATLTELKQRYEDAGEAPRLARQLIDDRLLTDWQARFLLSGRHQLRMGQYILQERIATRAIGDRFLAIHSGLNRNVEVILFPPGMADKNELFAEFLNRASRVARLDHPNLVQLYDIDQQDGRYYFVFEHDGGTPLDQLSPGRLDPAGIAGLSRQMLDALDYAHSRGLIHGQLNETQVCLDENNQVHICNVGLASLMDQLRHNENRIDAFSVQPVAADDAVAVGKLTRKLFHLQIGKPPDERSRLLTRILDDLSRLVDGTDRSAGQYREQIDEWIKLDADARLHGDPGADDVNSHQPQPASARVPAANRGAQKPVSSRTGANQDNAGIRMIATVVSGMTVLVLIGLLGYLTWGRNDQSPDLTNAMTLEQAAANDTGSSDPAKSETGRDSVTGRSKNSSLDQAFERARMPGIPVATDDKRGLPESDDAGESEPAEDEPAELLSPAKTGGASMVTETPLANSNPSEEMTEPSRDKSQQETADLLDGLTIIDWKDAAKFEGQSVAVRGTIVGIGQTRSGDIHFLNFDTADRNAFTAIVRDQNLNKFPGALEVLYRDKNVCVIGEISLFQGRVPQIDVISPDQIQLVEGEPSPPTGNQEWSSVFGELPRNLDIPVYSADSDAGKRVLGKIHCGDDLLGMEFVPLAGFSPRGGVFTVDRDASDPNRWPVQFAKRPADEPQTVGVFAKSAEELSFEWTHDIEAGDHVNYFRNGLLRIRTPDESGIFQLRLPTPIEPIVFTAKKPSCRQDLQIEDMPADEFVAIEVRRFPEEEFPDQNSELGYFLSVNQTSTEIYFHPDVFQRMLAIRLEFRTGTRLRVDAGLYVNTPEGFVNFREQTFQQLGEALHNLQARTIAEKQIADAYDPPYGQKTKHKDYVKELSKKLDLVNQQVESYAAATGRVQQILDRPIHFRVLYQSDDSMVELARTSGWSEAFSSPLHAEMEND